MTKTLPSSYITDERIVPIDVDTAIRHYGPGSGTGGIQVACNGAGCGIEYPAVWRQVHPWVQVQADLRIRQVTPSATSDLENFGKAIFTDRLSIFPETTSISPFASVVAVGYQRPAFMLGTLLQDSVNGL